MGVGISFLHLLWQGHDEEISYLGMAVEGSAMISLLVFGRLLDWTKAY